MALVAGWISFGILGPLLDMILGKYAAKPWETLDLLLRLSPLLLVFVTVFFSWPLVLIPPGARTEELRGDARWFEQHPFVGLALIGVVIVVSIAASRASHRWGFARVPAPPKASVVVGGGLGHSTSCIGTKRP